MYYNTKASGARIRELRLAKKLDQIELAELLNVSHGYISRIESGKKAKAIGLTERETAERDALRKEYLADMRAAFKQQLDSTYVQTADGAKIPYAEYAKLSKH